MIASSDTVSTGAQAISDIVDNDPPGCGNGDPAVCINGNNNPTFQTRFPPLFTQGRDITPFAPLTLDSGEPGSEAFYCFGNDDPQRGDEDNFNIIDFILSQGPARDSENLERVRGIEEFDRESDIQELDGRTVCALVFASATISPSGRSNRADLNGPTLGLTAFNVITIGQAQQGRLPPIIVNLTESSMVDFVCSEACLQAALLTGTPSSSPTKSPTPADFTYSPSSISPTNSPTSSSPTQTFSPSKCPSIAPTTSPTTADQITPPSIGSGGGDDSGGSSDTAMISGVVVAIVVVLALIIGYMCYRQRFQILSKENNKNSSTHNDDLMSIPGKKTSYLSPAGEHVNISNGNLISIPRNDRMSVPDKKQGNSSEDLDEENMMIRTNEKEYQAVVTKEESSASNNTILTDKKLANHKTAKSTSTSRSQFKAYSLY
eukprot:jgi/Bigna1/140928/aug1.59_g15636